MSDLIYVAVANPKGEGNHEFSEFMQHNQLVASEKDVVGLPLYINHNTPETLGQPVEASGIVTNGHVDREGKLVVGFTTFDNANGRLAKTLLGQDGKLPPELHMKEVSLGYDLKKDAVTGMPMFHKIKELSICYEGARDGTKILAAFDMESLVKQKNEEEYQSLSRLYKTLAKE